MATPPEATSEWVRRVEGRVEPLRYAATPEEALQRDQQAAFARHTLGDRVDAGGCTQVTLHKSRAGEWTLLLNGRQSVDVDDRGRHTLPRFDTSETIFEDATGRQVPAPVRVSVVLEQGACAPESVVLEVLQRTFVANQQIDEDREPVLTEVPLDPTRPGDVTSPSVVVAYPMALGPSAKIQLISRSKQRTKAAANSTGIASTVLQSVQAFVTNNSVFRPLGRLVNRVPGWLGLAGTAAYWYYFASAIELAQDQASNALLGQQLADSQYTQLMIGVVGMAYNAIQKLGSGSQPDGSSSADDQTVDISVFDLPQLLRRVGSSQTGGLYSRAGTPWTPDELRKARRNDDAALLEYLIYADALTEVQQKAQADRYRERLRTDGMNRTEEAIEEEVDKLRAVQEAAAKELAGFNRNQLVVTGLSPDTIRSSGLVESMLRLRVVDAHAGTGAANLQEFTLVSDVAFEAGLVASGYLRVTDDLDAIIAKLATQVRQRDPSVATSPLVNRLLLRSQTDEASSAKPTNLRVDLADFLVGRNRAIFAPSLNALVATLERLRDQVTAQLQTITGELKGLRTEPVAQGLLRRLPHVVATNNRAQLTFALERENEAIETAASGSPLLRASDGLRDAIEASMSTLRDVRRAIAQFVETEGVTRPRARTLLVMNPAAWSDAFVPTAAAELGPERPLPSLTPPLGIRTRHVYAPRIPIDVVASMTCRSEHKRVEEALVVRWLTAPGADDGVATDSAGVAARFGVPNSHVGELVLGMIADLATDEALDRARGVVDLSPTRAQLMATTVEAAVERLMVARDLARAVFRQRPVRVRVADHDALFACFPEGETLRKLLHESAVWRAWQAPWFLETGVPLRARYEVRAAAASAAPPGVHALEELLDALNGLKRVDWRLSCMPFLAPQTMAFHTDEALRMLHTGSPDGALKLRNAWAGLAAQVEHSYFAAQRLHVLAQGLRSPEAHRAAVLLECALTRPILGLVPTGARLDAVPLLEREWLRLLARPIAEELVPLQPGVDALPAAHTLLDRTASHECLRVRLATMRMDLGRLKTERVLQPVPVDTLVDAFARMDLGQPVQYLVPFGAAVEEEAFAAMTRCFEDSPIYVQAINVPTAVASDALVVDVRPRRARDADADVHPLALTLTTEQSLPVEVSVVVSNVDPVVRAAAAGAAAPAATLQEAVAQLRTGTAGPLGMGVDAAAAFVFAVERLTQCALAVAGSARARSIWLRANPPPPPVRTDVYVPASVLEPEPLRLAERRVWAVLLLIESGDTRLLVSVLQPSVPALAQELERLEAVTLAALGTAGRGVPEAEQLVAYLVKALDGKRDAVLDTAFRTTLAATFPPGLDFVDYLDQKEVALQQAQLAAAAAQSPEAVAAGVPLAPRVVPTSSAIATARYLNGVRARAREQFAEAQAENTTERSFGLAENARRRARAEAARRAELRLWPMVLGTANAVLRATLTDAPVLWHDAEWQDDALLGDEAPVLLAEGNAVLANATVAWRQAGLMAVPLCELAAVVVGGGGVE